MRRPPMDVPKPHDDGAQRHQPDGYLHRTHLRVAAGERHAEEEHANELLTILRAVHESHGRCAADLRRAETLVGLLPLRIPEEESDDPLPR